MMSIRSSWRSFVLGGIATAGLALGAMVAPVHAGSIEYITPAGSMTGGQPVDASATLTTASGSLLITLNNLEANPTSIVQALSDLQFTVGNGGSLTGATLSSSSGQGNHGQQQRDVQPRVDGRDRT